MLAIDISRSVASASGCRSSTSSTRGNPCAPPTDVLARLERIAAAAEREGLAP